MNLSQESDILFEIVEEVTGVTREQLLSRCRKRFIVDSKMMMAVAMRKNSRYKLWQIGDIFGGLNHATIVHYTRKVSELSNQDYNFRKNFSIINSRFKVIKDGGIPVEKKLQYALSERERLNKEINRLRTLIKMSA